MASLKVYDKSGNPITTPNVHYYNGTQWTRKNAYVYWNNKWNILTETFLTEINRIKLNGFVDNNNIQFNHFIWNLSSHKAGIIVSQYNPTGYNDTTTVYSGFGGNVNSHVFSNNLRPIRFKESQETWLEKNTWGDVERNAQRIYGISLDGNHVHVFDIEGTFLRTIDVGTGGNAFAVNTVEVTGENNQFCIYSKQSSQFRIINTMNVHKLIDVQLTGNVLNVFSVGETYYIMHKNASNGVCVSKVNEHGTIEFTKDFGTYESSYVYHVQVSFTDNNVYLLLYKTNGVKFIYQKYNYSTGIITENYSNSSNATINLSESITGVKIIPNIISNRTIVFGRLNSGKSKFYCFNLDNVVVAREDVQDIDFSNYTTQELQSVLSRIDNSKGELEVVSSLDWIHDNKLE